ncbi:hypothetical protein [Streptomyces sp. NPDC015125]|uniref:hypothetical protein n=1 Tax=Streptomyces sp. NPDC015125 TaxID=3364938 RepID=UPI0037007A74
MRADLEQKIAAVLPAGQIYRGGFATSRWTSGTTDRCDAPAQPGTKAGVTVAVAATGSHFQFVYAECSRWNGTLDEAIELGASFPRNLDPAHTPIPTRCNSVSPMVRGGR